MQKTTIWFAFLVFVALGLFAERYLDLIRRIKTIEATPAPSTSRPASDEMLNAIEKLRFDVQRLRREQAGQSATSAPVAAKDIMDRLDELSSELYDFEKQTQQNLITINTNVLRRLTDLGNSLAPKKSDPVELTKQLATEGITLDVAKGTITFKARPIMRERPLEVIVINDGGPGHESLFRSTARPSMIRLALLALGLESGGLMNPSKGDGPVGPALTIYVSWPGLEKPYHLEDTIQDIRTKNPMTNAKWVFGGSDFTLDFRSGRECYLPDDAHVLIALTLNYADSAVVACAQADNGNEQIWAARSSIFPDSPDTEVTVTISKAPIAEFERSK